MMSRSGKISGLGAVSPIGIGISAFTSALRQGQSGVRLLDFVNPHMRSTVAAECRRFDPASVAETADLDRLPRSVFLALAAAREAMGTAGLAGPRPLDTSRRIGLLLGTGGGGIDFTLDQSEKVHHGGRASLWTITNATHGNLAGELSIRLGLHGPSWCVSTGCASSSDAAGLALQMLRLKSVEPENPMLPDAWVVVGADAHVCWGVLYTMELLRVISSRDYRAAPEEAPTASRPFDLSRDGFVLGEGAWAMVLEREDWRPERPAVASLMGYAATCDAYHRVRPAPDMAEAVRAIQGAITDASLSPQEIDVVHYHGTGTQLNDTLETATLKAALRDRAQPVRGSSVKSMIGHPQGASGMASLVATICGLRSLDGGGPPFIPPTINLKTPDPACDLDYTPNTARELATGQAHTALINCLAFGAKNSALVVRA
jgi:3-oxoacyl-[acyl-carrier-protein] synthase II